MEITGSEFGYKLPAQHQLRSTSEVKESLLVLITPSSIFYNICSECINTTTWLQRCFPSFHEPSCKCFKAISWKHSQWNADEMTAFSWFQLLPVFFTGYFHVRLFLPASSHRQKSLSIRLNQPLPTPYLQCSQQLKMPTMPHASLLNTT